MGKKRRMLSSKKKFSAKYSNHPRMKYVMKTEDAKTTAAPVIEPTVATPPEIKTDIPVIKAAPTVVTDTAVVTTTPAAAKSAPAPEKAAKAPITKKAKTPKKKTRRSTTKSKTISRNA
jgi:hypothetical protein